MAGGKETPRQRMIGILYLVLLGLIALNVPESLMDAFRNITVSLDTSRGNVTTSINNTYTAFEATKLKEQGDKARKVLDTARQASKVVADLNTYIETLKAKLIAEGGGINPTIGDVSARDNLDISPRIMINQKNAEILRKKIEDTRARLLKLLGKDSKNVNFSLNTIDPPAHAGIKRNWEEAYFGDGIPLGATLTTLAKIQADAKNAENETVKKILGKVDQAVVNLDKFNAVAVAPTSYVLVGQPYTAQVFLTASDSHSTPDITVEGSKLPTDAGVGKYSGSTGSEGMHTWVGTIRVKQTDGTSKEYKTPPQTYQVAKPSAVVSPDKMNVLFIGVPNPVSVSAPGIPKEKLHVSVSNGSISGKDGKYEVTVSSPGDATVTVSGELSPGKTQVLGSTLFRIKRIPDPKAQFAGKSSGATSSANLKAQDRLFAKLENFYFDIKFDVVRFTMVIMKPRQDAIIYNSSNSELTSDMKRALSTIGPGTKVIFGNIMATGPGGQRGLDDIILSAN
ncbi:MAG: gliding motility protein GldM [Mucilaginibacter sp.]|nr:gliding motility protein GldM [Mucilaginibacter sp.]